MKNLSILTLVISALVLAMPVMAGDLEPADATAPELVLEALAIAPATPMSPDCKVEAASVGSVQDLDFTPLEAAATPCDDVCNCCALLGVAYCCQPCVRCIEPQ